MKAYYERDGLTLYAGDCRDVLAALPEASVDAVVCDPPYELRFMAKGWDGTGVAYDPATWAAALRVLKPGGHLTAFGAPRTYHRLACAVEDAGFELRDCLMWIFGSGFPKSLDVSKAIDKAAGAEREIVGPDAERWQGWGTALKPAYEPIVLARKPLAGTVAATVLEYGTGGLNIDASRIGDASIESHSDGGGDRLYGSGWQPLDRGLNPRLGRWPANVLLDEGAARLLDAQSGASKSPPIGSMTRASASRAIYDDYSGVPLPNGHGDSGGASRFFYTAKTSRGEREFGLDDLEPARRSDGRAKDLDNPRLRTNERHNDHPTVKPIDLMRWLCRLVTPPGGLILDPFLGSGSTGMAALDSGFRFVGVDLDPHYLEIARRRIARRHLIEKLPPPAAGQSPLFLVIPERL